MEIFLVMVFGCLAIGALALGVVSISYIVENVRAPANRVLAILATIIVFVLLTGFFVWMAVVFNSRDEEKTSVKSAMEKQYDDVHLLDYNIYNNTVTYRWDDYTCIAHYTNLTSSSILFDEESISCERSKETADLRPAEAR